MQASLLVGVILRLLLYASSMNVVRGERLGAGHERLPRSVMPWPVDRTMLETPVDIYWPFTAVWLFLLQVGSTDGSKACKTLMQEHAAISLPDQRWGFPKEPC